MIFKNLSEEIESYNKSYNIRKSISSKFIENGFLFYEPRIFESYDEINEGMRGFEKNKTIKALDGNGEVSILRPDITWEIINKFSRKMDIEKEYKIFYDGKIFKKARNINDGIVNQMGVEWININSEKSARNIISMGANLLKDNVNNFIMEIGDTEFIENIIRISEINSVDRNKLIEILIRKNSEDFNEWLEKIEMKEDIKELMSNILMFQGTYQNIKGALKEYKYKFIDDILFRLGKIDELMEESKFKKDIHYDLSLIPDHEYYKGIIFKGFSKDSFREILKGGRYYFETENNENINKEIFSVGFSIELDQLMKY